MSSIAARDANGLIVSLASTTTAGGNLVPLHGMLGGDAATLCSATNPLLTAPAIEVTTPVDHGGTIAAANVAQPAISANTARKGGWVQADPNNLGNIKVRLVSGSGYQSSLSPGATCPLTINGYVFQTEIDVAGSNVGDAYYAVEFV